MWQLKEADLLRIFQPGATLLHPLLVRSCEALGKKDHADLRVVLSQPDEKEGFRFIVESKIQHTPSAIRNAINQVKAALDDEQPMIVVPYLSSERLEDLEKELVSGVDLCGNGVVIVPGRLYILRTGQPNRYRESRPLNNPYAGRSAMVARMLLERGHWSSLGKLTLAIREAGTELSLPQASKAIRALQEDLMVVKEDRAITLAEPLRLLERLGQAFRMPKYRNRQALKLPAGTDWAHELSFEPELRWAVTGESSAQRYVVFGQGGPPRIAVSDLALALTRLGGVPERIPNFADIELAETDEPGCYFQNKIVEEVRWASPIQTWLELQAGDARQQDAAREICSRILEKVKP